MRERPDNAQPVLGQTKTSIGFMRLQSIQFLPKSFHEFCKIVGFELDGKNHTLRSKEYSEILEKESTGEWIFDLVVDLAKSVSQDQAESKAKSIIINLAQPGFTKEIHSSSELGHLCNKVWFFSQKYISINKPSKGDRKKLSSAFNGFKKIRDSAHGAGLLQMAHASDSVENLNTILLRMQNHAISAIINRIYIDREKEDKSRINMIRGIFPHNYIDLYCRATKDVKSPSDNPYRDLKRIGFGLESNFKPRPVRRESVEIDKHTESVKTSSKHILYVAGWSLQEEQD